MTFAELKLIEPILRAVQQEGYTEPTPIQAQAIPHVLSGGDLIACAQTGTGKTAAFALPILQLLEATAQAVEQQPQQRRNDRGNDRRTSGPRRRIRALVLSPTRELASQIADSFRTYGKHTGLRTAVIYGGVGQSPQVQTLRNGIDILVATPGRLLDLMGQGYVRLDSVEKFVLDEADRMLDMGFIHDVRKIIMSLPGKRQTLFFSATMPTEVQALADDILSAPIRVEVTPPATTVEKITQAVYFVAKRNKRALLEHLLDDAAIRRVLVFTRTKHGANKLAEQLEEAHIMAEAIHGNKSQSAREKALWNFKNGMTRVLVATDIAARGIDVDDVTHVINYDLPFEPESYVHRIGRTARAGASGIAFSFCDEEEFRLLRDIERLIRIPVPVEADHPFALPRTAYDAALNGGSSRPPRSGYANRGYQGNRNNNPSSGRSGARSGESRSDGRSSGGRDNRGESSGRSGYAGSSSRDGRGDSSSSTSTSSRGGYGQRSESGERGGYGNRDRDQRGGYAGGSDQRRSSYASGSSTPNSNGGSAEANGEQKRRRRRRGGARKPEPTV